LRLRILIQLIKLYFKEYMITKRFFYISFITLLIAFIAIVIWVHYDSLSDIDLVQNQLKASDMQVGILQVQNEALTKERNDLRKENEALYSGIEADTLILDYTTGLVHAYRVYVEFVQNKMKENGITYPEFVFKEVK